MKEPKMEKAGELLGLFLSGKQFEEGSKWAAFFSFWKKLLGERLASHSRIRDVRNGALIVEADHPGWIQMLQMKQSEIIREIGKRFPDIPITSIHIQLSERKFWNEKPAGTVSPEPPSGTVPKTGETDVPVTGDPPTDETGTEANPAIERIQDGSFRELLRRLEDSIRKREGGAHDPGN